MSNPPEDLESGLNVWDCLCIAGWIALLVPCLILRLIMKPFDPYTKQKTWRRFLGDEMARHACGMGIKRLRSLAGTTQGIYTIMARLYKLPVSITELENDSRLLWMGNPKSEKIILFMHGGGYVTPMQPFAFSFWRYVQQALERCGIQVGIAILNYTLVPTARFPTQLRQAVSAVEYLTSSGTLPGNIHIVGDSAGGNLALALLSHILHPLSSVPPVTATQPFAGIYTMSPWVRLSDSSHNNADIISKQMLETMANATLAGVPESLTPYIQPSLAPEGWFSDAHKYFGRFLITAGDREHIYDDVKAFSQRFKRENICTHFISQPDGMHDDPYLDFLLFEPKLGILTPSIVDWLAEGFGYMKE